MDKTHFFKVNTKVRNSNFSSIQYKKSYDRKTVRVPMYLIAVILNKDYYKHNTDLSKEEKTIIVKWVNLVCEGFSWRESSIKLEGSYCQNYTFNEVIVKKLFESFYYPYGIAYCEDRDYIKKINEIYSIKLEEGHFQYK